MDDFDPVSYLMGAKAGGGGGGNREWQFIKYVDTDIADGVDVTNEIAGHGYTEVLLILIDLATEETDKVQLGTAVYPISHITDGYNCRVYFYNGNVYVCGIQYSNGTYLAGVRPTNSRMAIYAR